MSTFTNIGPKCETKWIARLFLHVTWNCLFSLLTVIFKCLVSKIYSFDKDHINNSLYKRRADRLYLLTILKNDFITNLNFWWGQHGHSLEKNELNVISQLFSRNQRLITVDLCTIKSFNKSWLKKILRLRDVKLYLFNSVLNATFRFNLVTTITLGDVFYKKILI